VALCAAMSCAAIMPRLAIASAVILFSVGADPVPSPGEIFEYATIEHYHACRGASKKRPRPGAQDTGE
jgi:hypothetical protein